MIAMVCAVIALAAELFRGSFATTVPVTVLSSRAGLVMDPGAKVTFHGAQVGKVASIDERPDGRATLRLAMDPSHLHVIPANVGINIASSTVFGAKTVQFIPPQEPSPRSMYAGQIIDGAHVMVEINTIFEQLTSVLSKIEPAKLNETLGALAKGLNGRGEKIGQMLSNLDHLLATIDSSMPNLRHDISTAPTVLQAYADAAPDLISTVDNATRISQTVVNEQHNLDALLIATIGLADVGNDVVGTNSGALSDLVRMLRPTTDLTNEYHEALYCAVAGLVPFAKAPPSAEPGILTTIGLVLGRERYRYPSNLPKVASAGPPHCVDQGLPNVPPGMRPPFVVGDVGANPWAYGNQGPLVNSDLLKQLLYGPIDGPPRNVAQIGQPG
ncbi:MCE family protein [Mycobacterium paraintracellulare]|uniref:MCE family protein n=1 Tax=Mycobacterium paraintracellulare TaxID=1138383 RepID=UPI0019252E5E|nr:MCE family protein [Mycobacterium paraintracellulare]